MTNYAQYAAQRAVARKNAIEKRLAPPVPEPVSGPPPDLGPVIEAIEDFERRQRESNPEYQYLQRTWPGGAEAYIRSQQQRYMRAVESGDADLIRRLEADAQRVGYPLLPVSQRLRPAPSMPQWVPEARIPMPTYRPDPMTDYRTPVAERIPGNEVWGAVIPPGVAPRPRLLELLRPYFAPGAPPWLRELLLRRLPTGELFVPYTTEV